MYASGKKMSIFLGPFFVTPSAKKFWLFFNGCETSYTLNYLQKFCCFDTVPQGLHDLSFPLVHFWIPEIIMLKNQPLIFNDMKSAPDLTFRVG